MQSIRDRYLHDASLAIVLLGAATWSRRFVDWEIAAALGLGDDEPLALVAVDLDGRMPSRLPLRLWAAIQASPAEASTHHVGLPCSRDQLERAITDALRHPLHEPSNARAALLRVDLRPPMHPNLKACQSSLVTALPYNKT